MFAGFLFGAFLVVTNRLLAPLSWALEVGRAPLGFRPDCAIAEGAGAALQMTRDGFAKRITEPQILFWRAGMAGSGAIKASIPLHEPGNAFLHGGVGLVAHGGVQLGDVCVGVWHVAGLQGQHVLDGFFAHGTFDGVDVGRELDGAVVADVEQAPGGVAGGGVWACAVPGGVGRCNLVAGANDAFDNVINVGEVSAVVAVVEDLYGLAFEDVFGELEQGHVGPAPGSIHGEEAQAGGGQAEQVAVAVGHEFVGAFGGGVELQGVHGGHVF